MSGAPMTLVPGTRLGPYAIVEAIGKGGMGEVYKATDTRLSRTVAIKILPADWANDAGMKERFDREAQAIASLSHPNICALHDLGRVDGISYLVMEYLHGETLAARISRGALTLDEALDVAVPIAKALEQAHRRGVIHRDFKPGNIMLTESGPKLLDFGLARTPATTQRTSGSGSPLPSAMPTTPLTVPGLLIGTLQYMAPEQLDGLEADARTDIFAFGAVLHEMITGKRAFEGKSQVLLISSIATSEPPPLRTAEPATPPALEHVVKTCLAKDPDNRWQTVRDLLTELEWIAAGGAAATAIMPAVRHKSRSPRRLIYAIAALGIVGAVLAVPAYSYFQAPPPPAELRFRLWTSPFDDTPHGDGYFAISPDGSTVAYRGDEDNVSDPNGLYITKLGELGIRRVPNTDEPTQIFWSPDSKTIAFVINNRLKKVDAAGELPEDLAAVPGMRGGTWGADNTILFGSDQGIYRVSAEGGTPELMLKTATGEIGSYWPHFLPDGRRFLYVSLSNDPAKNALMAGSLDSADRTHVMTTESAGLYTTSGHLVFRKGEAVYAQAFDPDTLKLSGQPSRLAAEVLTGGGLFRGAFDVSRTGVLVYGQANATIGVGGVNDRLGQLTWIDRVGQERQRVGTPQLFRGIELSPDETRIATHRHDQTGGDIWIIEPTGTETRLTFDPGRDNSSPIWSFDNQYIVFGAKQGAKYAMLRRLSDGRGTEDVLFELDKPLIPMSWSPDGKRIVFGVMASAGNADLWMLTLESAGGGLAKDTKPGVFLSTPADETYAQISPDGRWIAYASNMTKSEQYETYVRPFPAGAGIWQVSRIGGQWPRWMKDGRELLFTERLPDGSTLQLGVVNVVKYVVKGDTFMPDPPKPTLRIRAVTSPHPGGDYTTYAVRKDGNLLIWVWSNLVAASVANQPTVAIDEDTGLTVVKYWQKK